MKRIKKLLKESPINFFSDLFIVAMVCMWICDNLYETVVATAVTVSSIVISFQTGCVNVDTSMWSNIGSNVAMPLATGGAIWMIKNGVQHAIFNRKGEEAPMDFPRVDAEFDGDERPAEK